MDVRINGLEIDVTYVASSFMALTATLHVDIVRIRMCVTIQQATVQTVVRISGQETGVRNVFPTNMDQTVHLIVVIAKMESHVSQKAEFAPMVANLDGSVIFV